MNTPMIGPLPPPDPPPPLRVPDWPLPPYRFVPGLNPHPFRHPDGHMYTDGSPPPAETWDPTVSWEQDTAWLRGLDLFDHCFYWEAHEVWEGIWRSAPRDDPYAELLQGLIQAAAFLLKQHMGQEAAAEHLRSASAARLSSARDRCGSSFRGVELDCLLQALDRRALEPPPLATVTRPAQDQSGSDPTP